MFSRFLTKAFLLIFLLGLFLKVLAQTDSIPRTSVPSPYKSEYNPWFKFSKFKRGFDNDSLRICLDDLENRPRTEWSKKDSLNFARTTLQTGKLELSEYYFDHLDISYETENKYWWDHIMLYILTKNYEAGIENIHKSSPGILQYSKIYFLDKFLIASKAQAADSKWYKTNAVLDWEVDSSLFEISKNSDRFKEEILQPIENLNFVLNFLIHHIHESDPIITRVCLEMGVILENHVSLTQAYIAYNLGRNYNKRDKEILNRIKLVKAKLSEKKYKIPIFTRYLPRIERWRFEYEVLKEKIIQEKNDTLTKQTPVLMLEAEEPMVPMRSEWIIIAGIGVMFLLVLLFLRPRKKN